MKWVTVLERLCRICTEGKIGINQKQCSALRCYLSASLSNSIGTLLHLMIIRINDTNPTQERRTNLPKSHQPQMEKTKTKQKQTVAPLAEIWILQRGNTKCHVPAVWGPFFYFLLFFLLFFFCWFFFPVLFGNFSGKMRLFCSVVLVLVLFSLQGEGYWNDVQHDRILLTSIQVGLFSIPPFFFFVLPYRQALTFHEGKMTTGRRSSPVQQLVCLGLSLLAF